MIAYALRSIISAANALSLPWTLPFLGATCRRSKLPSTQALIAAHGTAIEASKRVRHDPQDFPPVALDSAHAVGDARGLLLRMRSVLKVLDGLQPTDREVLEAFIATADRRPWDFAISSLKALELDPRMEEVLYDRSEVPLSELLEAAKRGASGQKPVSGFFARALKRAVGSVTLGGREPGGANDWRLVESVIRLESSHASALETVLKPLQPLKEKLPRRPQRPRQKR